MCAVTGWRRKPIRFPETASALGMEFFRAANSCVHPRSGGPETPLPRLVYTGKLAPGTFCNPMGYFRPKGGKTSASIPGMRTCPPWL